MTFYELKAKLHFLTLAGSVRCMNDLWPLYDLLCMRSVEVGNTLNLVIYAEKEGIAPNIWESIIDNLRVLQNLYIHDADLVEEFCIARGLKDMSARRFDDIPF